MIALVPARPVKLRSCHERVAYLYEPSLLVLHQRCVAVARPTRLSLLVSLSNDFVVALRILELDL